MQTITQRWRIPSDRHVRVDLTLSSDVPEGEADAVIIVVPQSARLKKRNLTQFFGCLKQSKALVGDPVRIQRKLRDEWERVPSRH